MEVLKLGLILFCFQGTVKGPSVISVIGSRSQEFECQLSYKCHLPGFHCILVLGESCYKCVPLDGRPVMDGCERPFPGRTTPVSLDGCQTPYENRYYQCGQKVISWSESFEVTRQLCEETIQKDIVWLRSIFMGTSDYNTAMKTLVLCFNLGRLDVLVMNFLPDQVRWWAHTCGSFKTMCWHEVPRCGRPPISIV